MKRDQLVEHRDADWIADALEHWDRTRRMSLRGLTPSPRLMQHVLQSNVVVQNVIWADDGHPAGLLQVADLSDRDGFGQLELLVDSAQVVEVGQEVADFLSEVFEEHPSLRKLCVWASVDELDVPGLLGGLAHQAGCLAEHDRRGPRYYADTLVYEIWREDVV